MKLPEGTKIVIGRKTWRGEIPDDVAQKANINKVPRSQKKGKSNEGEKTDKVSGEKVSI